MRGNPNGRLIILDPVRKKWVKETPKPAPEQPSGRMGKSGRFGNRCPKCGSYYEGGNCGNCH